MKKLILGLLATFVFSFAFVVSPVSAASDRLHWRQEVNNRKCDERVGRPVINAIQHVKGDADSGLGGYWAFDKYVRHIKVFDNENGTYCVLVSYLGRFDAQAGQNSPGNTGILDGDEDGVFSGGYRAEITGTLKADPDWKTKGFVGSFDYGCDLSGNCTGAVSWVDQYFESGSNFQYEWWGWQYRSPRHGSWTNSSDGNSGDIL